MTIYRMRIACGITRATNTRSGCVILLFHCNSACTNAPGCYIVSKLPLSFYHVAVRCITDVSEKFPASIFRVELGRGRKFSDYIRWHETLRENGKIEANFSPGPRAVRCVLTC